MSSVPMPPLARVVPPAWRLARRPHRMIERSLMAYRRTWMIFVSGFFEPLFYLLSVRVGFGALIGDLTFAGRSVSYAEFVAPALMASSAMNGAVYDSTMNVYYKMKYAKTYDAVLATPLGAPDVALGEIAWAMLRGTVYSGAFLVCLVALDLAPSPWVVLALPACVLIGFAFAAAGMAVTTFMRSWADFDLIPVVTLPLFLFSATFYPLSSSGPWAWIVQLSPLYHGVALVRAASLGIASWGIIAHVAVLATMSVVGLGVASRRVDALLLP